MVHCILQLKSTFETYIRYLFRRFLFFVVVVLFFFLYPLRLTFFSKRSKQKI